MGAPPYGRRIVQRVVLVNVAEPIEFPGALLKGSRPPSAVPNRTCPTVCPAGYVDPSLPSLTHPSGCTQVADYVISFPERVDQLTISVSPLRRSRWPSSTRKKWNDNKAEQPQDGRLLFPLPP